MNDWPNWIVVLYLSFPITLIIWTLGIWATWKDYQTERMTEEVDLIINKYIISGVGEVCDGITRELFKVCWNNKWKPSKVFKILDKRFVSRRGYKL